MKGVPLHMAEQSDPAPRGLAAVTGDIAAALAFMTRLPLTAPPARPLAASAWAFPVAGWAVGAAAGAVLLLASETGFPPLACALLALAAAAWLTGALHEDGLADLADGLGASRFRERILAVMRDSRIGSFGVLALVLVVALKAAALAGMPDPGTAALALIAAHGLARALIVPVMWLAAPARADGLGAGAGRAEASTAARALGLGALVPFLLIDPASAFWMAVLATAAAAVTAWLANRRLGGATGDVLGAVEQVAETAALLAAARAVL